MGEALDLLEASQLVSGYGQFTVLHQVSLRVPQAQVVSVVGANGAGKTTLLKTLAGLIPPKSGSIHLHGEAIETLPAHRRASLGISLVPEGRRLFPEMTVLENLLVAATHPRARPERDETLRYVFDLFPRLRERQPQTAGTLSGGEQQMLAIGRGLMARPEVLMLDEPSLGLAPLMVRDVFRVVTELHRRGQTILIVEQNLRETLAISDYAYVLESGEIAVEGRADVVLAHADTRRAYLGV